MLPPLRPQDLAAVSLADVAAAVGLGAALGESVAVRGITLDSRAVQPGDVYAALPGATTHGGRFAAQAAAAGAVAVLTDPRGARWVAQAAVDLPLLVVDDPRAVLGAASACIYRRAEHDLLLFGITGTNGKTTTAYLIHSALTAMGVPTGLIGTVETRIGAESVRSERTTPEAPDVHALLTVMAERGVRACVMEVSSHALSLHRVDGVVFDVAVFTNLSQDHLDFHGDMGAYFAAKAQLFTPRRARAGVVFVDDAAGAELADSVTVPLTTVGTGEHCDWRIDAAEPGRADFTLSGAQGSVPLHSHLPGDFNIVNTALAAVALLVAGQDLTAVAAAIHEEPHVPGRMEVVPDPASERPDAVPVRAVVDYAHTPEAIRAALAALRPSTPGALVCVTGAGGDRDRDKRHAMGAAAAQFADVVIVTDDNPRSEDPAEIRAAVLSGAREVAKARAAAGARPVTVLEVPGRRSAIREAVARARASGGGATLALVGKGHERGQEIAGQVHAFDDRDELRDALKGEGATP